MTPLPTAPPAELFTMSPPPTELLPPEPPAELLTAPPTELLPSEPLAEAPPAMPLPSRNSIVAFGIVYGLYRRRSIFDRIAGRYPSPVDAATDVDFLRQMHAIALRTLRLPDNSADDQALYEAMARDLEARIMALTQPGPAQAQTQAQAEAQAEAHAQLTQMTDDLLDRALAVYNAWRALPLPPTQDEYRALANNHVQQIANLWAEYEQASGRVVGPQMFATVQPVVAPAVNQFVGRIFDEAAARMAEIPPPPPPPPADDYVPTRPGAAARLAALAGRAPLPGEVRGVRRPYRPSPPSSPASSAAASPQQQQPRAQTRANLLQAFNAVQSLVTTLTAPQQPTPQQVAQQQMIDDLTRRVVATHDEWRNVPWPPTQAEYRDISNTFTHRIVEIWNEFRAAFQRVFGTPALLAVQDQAAQNTQMYIDAINTGVTDWTVPDVFHDAAVQRLQTITCTDEVCNICYGPMNEAADDDDPDRDCVHPVCGHQFHRHCIVQWYRQSVACPLCRRSALS